MSVDKYKAEENILRKEIVGISGNSKRRREEK